jgi:hypothetical protein
MVLDFSLKMVWSLFWKILSVGPVRMVSYWWVLDPQELYWFGLDSLIALKKIF